jgi:PTH1 family peptidyl-tRNA hydrolase
MALFGPHFIIGLGNPGQEYERTRHNVGFAVIDALAAELGVNYWKVASNALVGELSYRGEKIVLAKPQSFMNLSGGPIKGIAGRYGFDVEELLVIHDELDLPDGVVRLKLGGGHAGHNGLRSLHQAIGADYARLRVGIGRPPGRMAPRNYVLQRMSGQELKEFEVTVAYAASMARATLEDGLSKAMNICNRSDESGRSGEGGCSGEHSQDDDGGQSGEGRDGEGGRDNEGGRGGESARRAQELKDGTEKEMEESHELQDSQSL